MGKSQYRDRDKTLFETAGGAETTRDEPLAARMRPRTVEEFVGQDHIMGPGRLLRRAIQADMLSSVIFYGPPGTGKTTLARVIANSTRSKFVSLNAVLSGVKEVREAIAEAQNHRSLYGRKTILFVDEVHRWNKAQQDALLPWVENGTVVLIGATTENPFFEVNSALVSRSRVFQLTALTSENMYAVARAAIEDPSRGYGKFRILIDQDALDHLVSIADGDARTLLNALQLAVETTPQQFPPEPGAEIHVDLKTAEESIQQKVVLYDKEGDYHFDTISAFIKSLRGSDPDAALYWLARMVRAGEDPHFLFRRMLISASEDVGLADPMALVVVQAAAAAFDRIGFPEGQFHLTHAALYLATAPKSNSALGYFDALKSVEEEAAEVPVHLKDASRDKEGFGHGEGYLYPHAYRDHWVAQAYLPAALRGRIFYHPSKIGYEERIRAEVERRREIQLAAMLEDPPTDILTFTPESRSFQRWIDRTAARAEHRGNGVANKESPGLSVGEILETIRTRLFDRVPIRRHDRVFLFDPSQGSLIWEAVRRAREGMIFALVPDERNRDIVNHTAEPLPEIERPTVIAGSLSTRFTVPEQIPFDVLIARDPFTRIDRETPGTDYRAQFAKIAQRIAEILIDGGTFAIAQIVPGSGQRLSQLVRFSEADEELRRAIGEAEQIIYSDSASPLVGWTASDLCKILQDAGLSCEIGESAGLAELRMLRKDDIDRWLTPSANPGAYGTVVGSRLTEQELERYRTLLNQVADSGPVPWQLTMAFLAGRKG